MFNEWQINLLQLQELNLSSNMIGPEIFAIELVFQQKSIKVDLSKNQIHRISFDHILSLEGKYITPFAHRKHRR